MDASSPKPAAYTPKELLDFMRAGVFTLQEVRNMVSTAMGCAVAATPKVATPKVATPNVPKPKVATPNVATPTVGNSPQDKPKRKLKRLVFAPAASPSLGKSRKRKPQDDPERDLRDVVKNTARRRFFNECCRLDSKLWQNKPNSDKQFMYRFLFDRAAVEVIDVLRAEEPGKLRKKTDEKIREIIR